MSLQWLLLHHLFRLIFICSLTVGSIQCTILLPVTALSTDKSLHETMIQHKLRWKEKSAQ